MSTSSAKTGLISDKILSGNTAAMGAPTAADGGTGSTASITFTAVTGAITYRVLSSGGQTATGTSSPITVSGLTTGSSYTFQIQVETSTGYSGYSLPSNSITIAVPTLSEVEALAVAGGGGSSSNGSAGGGGAGGAIYYATQPITIGTTYNFTIGAGGGQGSNGSNSTAFSMTAFGGGFGGGGQKGGNGGSGGGNWYNDTGSAGQKTQTNNGGGTGYGSNGLPGSGGSPFSGGGGGGASGSGQSGRSFFGTTYASGGSGGTGSQGSNGTANRGNGGNSNNSSGGSGVVIIRYSDIYANAASTTGSPTFTNSGGYKTYTFTGSGSITF